MALDSNVIDSAVNKKYTEFSASIKKELMNKMANHVDAKQYAKDYDQIQTLKGMYAEIGNYTEE
jgi:5'-deoxynucleotidase YfbR-like HD superfamily hydrolase